MNRPEERILCGIERRQGKAATSARFAELDRMAQSAVSVPFASAGDALTYLRLVVGHAFSRMTGFDTRHQTRAYFGRLASGDDFQSLAKSLSWADAQWSRATGKSAAQPIHGAVSAGSALASAFKNNPNPELQALGKAMEAGE